MSTNNRARISTFKANSQLDYARPNLFQVDIDWPPALVQLIASGSRDTGQNVVAGTTVGALAASSTASSTPSTADSARILGAFTIKAAQIPASTVGVIEVPFRGRMLKIAGDRTFEPWTITVHNDTSFVLRSYFERWMEAIQLYDENATDFDYGQLPSGDPQYLKYMAPMRVSQLDRRGNAVRSYDFVDVWPSNISAIDLDYGSNDAIEEYTVELQVQYWRPIPISSGASGGTAAGGAASLIELE
ncbi:tail tube protein [Synechococcus phage S-CREM1]|nr:tail tube protein [Synechococcus phage S-CREM1]